MSVRKSKYRIAVVLIPAGKEDKIVFPAGSVHVAVSDVELADPKPAVFDLGMIVQAGLIAGKVRGQK